MTNPNGGFESLKQQHLLLTPWTGSTGKSPTSMRIPLILDTTFGAGLYRVGEMGEADLP